MKRSTFVVIAGLFGAFVFAGYALLTTVQSNHARSVSAYNATKQLCVFVDDEHNRERADVLRGERELYTKYAKTFSTFIDTAEKRRQIHESSERAYYEVRKTRPDYCKKVRKNPVKPYPSLEEIRQ